MLAFGIDVVPLAIGPETNFRPTVEALDGLGPLDGLVIASPSNPTGTVLDRDQLTVVVEWAKAKGVRLVADEIYHGITFEHPAPTALGIDPDVIVLNSFSKYFSMTGWRLGWVVAPPAMAEAIERLAQSLTVAPPTLSQLAAIAAFDCYDELEANVARYGRNRSILLDGLPAGRLRSPGPGRWRLLRLGRRVVDRDGRLRRCVAVGSTSCRSRPPLASTSIRCEASDSSDSPTRGRPMT